MPSEKTKEQAEQTLLNAVFGSGTVERHQNLLGEHLDEVLKTLTYREREVLKLCYGINGGGAYTLAEVGEICKITRERVRQVESKAIRKLQHPIRARKLWELLCPIPLVYTVEFLVQQPSLVADDRKTEFLNRPWDEVLNLSARSRKILQRLCVNTVRDLTTKTEVELLIMKNFGETSLNEVKQQLQKNGLSLAT